MRNAQSIDWKLHIQIVFEEMLFKVSYCHLPVTITNASINQLGTLQDTEATGMGDISWNEKDSNTALIIMLKIHSCYEIIWSEICLYIVYIIIFTTS